MSEIVSALGRMRHAPLAAPTPAPAAEASESSAQADAGAISSATAGTAVSQPAFADDIAVRVAALYRELFPAVYGFIRFRVGDAHVAEDLTATVFERALGKLTSVRKPERVRGWLFTVARNAVADERRRRRPAAPLDAAELLEHLWVDSPERLVVDRDEWRRLLTYLAELDDRDREILGLRFAAGLGNREVGQVVGLNRTSHRSCIAPSSSCAGASPPRSLPHDSGYVRRRRRERPGAGRPRRSHPIQAADC